MIDNDWPDNLRPVDDNQCRDDGNAPDSIIEQGRRLGNLRDLADLSPLEFAERLDLSLTQVVALEAGMVSLDRELALRIADEFDINISEVWLNDTN